MIPEPLKAPVLTDDQYKWIVDGTRLITFEPVPLQEPQFVFRGDTLDMGSIDWETPGNLIPTVDPAIQLTTTGSYDHNLGGYSLSNQWDRNE